MHDGVCTARDTRSAIEAANRPLDHAPLEQLPGQSDGLGALLSMRVSALALAVALADAVAGKPQLGDCHRLIDLHDRAEDLAEKRRRRRFLGERTGAIAVVMISMHCALSKPLSLDTMARTLIAASARRRSDVEALGEWQEAHRVPR